MDKFDSCCSSDFVGEYQDSSFFDIFGIGEVQEILEANSQGLNKEIKKVLEWTPFPGAFFPFGKSVPYLENKIHVVESRNH